MSTITSVIVPTATTLVADTSSPSSTSISEVQETITTNTIMTYDPLTTILYSPTPTNTYGSETTTSSNTGDIVGGVVGGIAAICLLAFLLFYTRRHRRRIVSFPTKPPWSVGNNIAPFPHPDRDVNQYGDNPNLSAGASDRVGREKSQLNTDLQPPDLSTYNYPHGARPLSWEIYEPFVRPSLWPHTQDSNTDAMPQTDRHNPRREHDLATRQEVDGDSSGVVQHQDAGHVPSESGEVLLRDIPPTYESIVQ